MEKHLSSWIISKTKTYQTFQTIAQEGYDGFYHGWVANDMFKKLRSIGGNHTFK